jgi:hypothetical protein
MDGGRHRKNYWTGPAYSYSRYGFAKKGRPNMDGNTSDPGTDCDSGLHTEHLCYIISQGFNLTDEQGYQALVEKPAFQCGHCGRTAKSGTNLCVPVGL